MKKTWTNTAYMLRLIWKTTPSYVLLEILQGVIMGVWGSADVVFVKLFYDCVSQNRSFAEAAGIIAGMVGVTVLSQWWFQWYRNVKKPILQQKTAYAMNKSLFEKAKTLDLACYDNPDYYNDFVWAMNQSDSQAAALLNTISNAVTMLVTMVTTTAVISTVSPVLALLAIASAVVTILLNRRITKVDFDGNTAKNPVSRKCSYYERIFSTPDYAKEIRIEHVDEVITEKYDESLRDIRSISEKFNFERMKYRLPLSIISDLMQPIVYIILLYQIMVTRTTDLGGLAVAFSAFWNLRGRLQSFVTLMTRLPEHALYTEKVRTFLNNQPKISSGVLEVPAFESLELKNVSFAYSKDVPVLHDINLTIRKGEKVAIVGYNGAGKTTLVKLLMHLYEPTAGQIEINGRPVEKYNTASWQNRISAVFQDYRIFALSVAENVLCGTFEPSEGKKVEKALEYAAFDNKLPELENGVCTELTREFYEDGTNLSGGESQKIAIARIFTENNDLIIMDEPSSALDPMAEYRINRNIMEYAKDKTVIMISHRLSTTRDADRIYMFEDGRIIEAGSHEELMKADGKYAEMFRIQAEKYIEV